MISDVEGNRCWGRRRLRLMDGVRMVIGERGTSMKQGRLKESDRKRWESAVRSE